MKTRLFLLLVSVFCLSASVFAQESDAVYKAVEPLVTTNTYLVAHVDLEKLDLDAFFDKLKPRAERIVDKMAARIPGSDAEIVQTKSEITNQLNLGKTTASSFVQGFIGAGINELYVLGTMELMQQYPVVVAVPGDSELSPQADMLFMMMQLQRVGFRDGMTFFVMIAPNMADPSKTPEPKGLFTFMDVLKTADRPEIREAFALHAKSPAKIVLAPSDGLKLLAQMMIPTLLAQAPSPQPIDQKVLLDFIQKTKSSSLGINPAMVRINFALQVTDEETAKSMAEQVQKALDESIRSIPSQLAEMPQEMRDAVIKQTEAIKPFYADLLPKPLKDRLISVFNEKLLDKHEDALIDSLVEGFMTGMRAGQ